MKKILIIKLGALGDVILSQGALKDLRAHHAKDHITILTTKPYEALFQKCPYVDEVLIDPRAPRWRLDQMWSLRNLLKREDFSYVYDLQNQNRTAFYHKWFLKRVPWCGKAPTASCPHPFDLSPLPLLEGLKVQLETAGVKTLSTLTPDISWMVEDVGKILKEEGVQGPYVLLLAGASPKRSYKRWPYYKELAEMLISEGFQVVTAPMPLEREAFKEIPGTMLTNGGKGFSLFQLCGIINKSQFVIGNDTGPTHIASHLKKPGIGIFGTFISPERACIERGEFTCLQNKNLAEILPKTVFSAFKDKINSKNYKKHLSFE